MNNQQTASMMNRVFSFLYGTGSYALFFATFLYAIGFVGNFGVPKSMDSASTDPWQTAIMIDAGLLSLFALQHSVMARPAFKRMLTCFIPATLERSTYVLASSLALLFLFWQWRPLGGRVWEVQSDPGRMMLYAGFGFGWTLVLVTTFVINHFDLFGLRQVWRHLRGEPQEKVKFVMPMLYRIVRHPLYVGWFFAFWCTPTMTVTHLFFAIMTTVYILVAIQFEERDLMREHPEYAEYRKQVPMLIPGLTPKRHGMRAAASAARMTTLLTLAAAIAASPAFAQEAPKEAANWKTWVIASGQDHGVPMPPEAAATRGELEWLHQAASMANSDPRIAEQVRFWDAGPPTYRWMELVAKRQSAGEPVGAFFVRAHTYVALAMYDANVAAWNAKQAYRRPRPSEADSTMRARVPVPASRSYPSDYAATAAAAATVMAYLVPGEAAYFLNMAEEAGKSRLYAGVEYPSDYFAGMELGRRVAEQVIAKARADGSDAVWSGTVPTGPCMWRGVNPGNVTGANWRPLLLTSPSEFRPAPPPSCESAEVQAQLAAVRNFPRALTTANLNTNARALYWQTNEGVFPWALTQLNRWILEDKLEMNPLRAARAYALLGAVGYDAFIASQDGKYAYWYIRPSQLDPSLAPLFAPPNFPSYPSNHSVFSTARSEVLAYLFPDRADQIRALGKEAGDSRIWAGIHFEMDNQSGVKLGKSIAQKVIDWAESDGSGR